MPRLRETLFILWLLALSVTLSASGWAATLVWDPNLDQVNGYKVYYGTSATNVNRLINVGKATSLNLDRLPLTANVPYWFCVSAYNTAGESGKTTPLSYTPTDAPPPPPPTGLSDKAFGKIMGGDQRHVNEVNYFFEGRTGDVQLEYEVWDVDFSDEVQIVLNGVEIGFAPLTGNETWSGTQVLPIPDRLVNDNAVNYLTFNNTFNPPNGYWWGIRSVSVRDWVGYSLPSYAADGKIMGGDQRHVSEVNYFFEGRIGDIQLAFEVWDVDYSDEVQILLNGVEIGFAPLTGNETWSGTQVLPIPDRLVNDNAENYLTFNNTFNPPNVYWWGVRFVTVLD